MWAKNEGGSVRPRVCFWAKSTVIGVRLLGTLLGALGEVLLLLGLVSGLAVSVWLWQWPPSIALGVLLLLFLVVFAEGAYREASAAGPSLTRDGLQVVADAIAITAKRRPEVHHCLLFPSGAVWTVDIGAPNTTRRRDEL